MEKLIKGLPKKEYNRQWRLDNPEKVKENRKNYQEKQKICIKQWQQEHREERNNYQNERNRRKKLEEQNNKAKGE